MVKPLLFEIIVYANEKTQCLNRFVSPPLTPPVFMADGFKGEGVFFIQENFNKDLLFDMAENHLKTSQSAMSLTGWVDMGMEGDYLADLYLLK